MNRIPLLLVSLLASSAFADVTLSPMFQDHAVLQRDKPAPVWGQAAPGEHVTVSFLGQTVGATADEAGRWIVLLTPMEAAATGADLVVTGKNVLTLHDVVVGEVWLCSGQSNMEFTVNDPVRKDFSVNNAAREVAAAKYPLIRQFKVAPKAVAEPLDEPKGAWSVCSPETVPLFTAVGYFFARDLHRRLGVPIGLINSTWGGTGIEAWMSPAGIAALRKETSPTEPDGPPELKPKPPAPDDPRWASGKDTVGRGDPTVPGSLFNGMINPVLPYALRGVIWYQGEHNANAPGKYAPFFASLITTWRLHLGKADLPFFWVQLADYKVATDPSGRAWATLREDQAKALSLPGTGQAIAIDVGDPKTVHPRNKQEVGRRLALIAKAKVYGVSVDYSGPVFVSATREGAKMRVRFKYASMGLTAAARPLQSFEIAGADKQYYPAIAVIEGETVVVKSPKVREPVAVRYAWADEPEANLYNGAGLPAGPFRSE